MTKVNYLNLGCGSRFHPLWTNVDFTSAGDGVVSHDLRKGLDYPDNSFNVVYHSHLLEHFSKSDAERFIKECSRVLRSGGILRVAVPDLELLVKTYLKALENAVNGAKGAEPDYEWIMLHLYDQTVRNTSGGEMSAYIEKEYMVNEDFVVSLWGVEGRKAIEKIRKNIKDPSFIASTTDQKTQLLRKLLHFAKHPSRLKEIIIELLLGNEYEALQLGRFRKNGEVHQWMYDRYSLSLLLQRCGFEGVIRRTAIESSIPEWNLYNLDTESDGTVYRPDSLYMEAVRP